MIDTCRLILNTYFLFPIFLVSSLVVLTIIGIVRLRTIVLVQAFCHQQYIAMFYQSLDAWTLIRRSQVLEFPPHFQPETGYGAVNAGTKDNPYAYIPQRLVYPDSEKTNNEYELTKGIANLDGQDAMSTKLWFALPTKTNPYLTNN